MHYLHKNNVVLSNLFPSNIVLMKDKYYYYPYIFDFNEAIHILSTEHNKLISDTHTNPGYIPQECFKNSCKKSKEIDVYSYGTILLNLYGNQNRYHTPPLLIDFSGQIFNTIINKCRCPKPEDRISFKEILDFLNSIRFNINSTIIDGYKMKFRPI